MPYIQLYNQNIKILYCTKYHSILEALETNNVQVNFQCREGYCGMCRTSLISGNVTYAKQPLAHIKNTEILICYCVPTNNIQLKIIK